jgi:hypothetical protein
MFDVGIVRHTIIRKAMGPCCLELEIGGHAWMTSIDVYVWFDVSGRIATPKLEAGQSLYISVEARRVVEHKIRN